MVIKGAGDLATGIAYCLHRRRFRVLKTEIERPTVVRRSVSFAEAVFDGSTTVEGVTARLADGLEDVTAMLGGQEIPILVDPTAETAVRLRPLVVSDAVMAKRNLGTALSNAPVVIGVGPGFRVGTDVAAVWARSTVRKW